MKQNKPTNINEPSWDFTLPQFIPSLVNSMALQISAKKNNFTKLLFIVVITGFVVNQLLLTKINANSTTQNVQPNPTASSPSALSNFDQDELKKMRNENKSPLVIGSAHEHADFKVYVNGTPLSFAKPEYFMKSSFMHVDNSQNEEDASGVLHMHAKNTSLELFFRSLGMELLRDSFKTADGQVFKNGNGNTLKFYLNGNKVDELSNYSFQPLDKLLISYGPENDQDLRRQIDSITNFAKDHQK